MPELIYGGNLMRKHMIRVISALLAVCLTLTAAPLTGFTGLELAMKAKAYAMGDHIQIGNYPQNRVADKALIANLDAVPKTWKSYRYYSGTDDWIGGMAPSDFMQFADFFYGGNKYRAVTFSDYRPYITSYTQSASNSKQDENGYEPNRIYYFLYEPIDWRILDPADGLILSEMILDSQAYQNTIFYYINYGYEFWQNTSASTYASHYATSSIRDWLNYDFYETAFTDAQKNNIRNDVTLNNDSPYFSAYNSASTKDKIFFLSYDEAKTGSYGFSSSASYYDVSRRARGTDYAQCQGLYVYRSSGSVYDGFSWWWLRSPDRSNGACSVSGRGCSSDEDYVYYTDRGVRAACRLANLQSDISQSQNLFSETAGGSVPSGISDGCKIPVNNNSAVMAVGDNKVLSATIDNPKKQKLLYSSSDPSVVSVSVVGVATAKSLGTAIITVQTYDKQHSVTCEITVAEKTYGEIPISAFYLNRHEIELKAYQSYQLDYNIEPWNASNRQLTWRSSDNNIATVGGNNVITAHSKGTAVITFTTADGRFSDSITVKVTGNDLEQNATTVSYSIGGNFGTVDLFLKSNWFLIDSSEYNHEMAQLCSRLMMLGYTDGSTVRGALTGLGFNGKNNATTVVELSQPRTSVNYYISSKIIMVDGVEQMLVIAGFIGSDHEQWFDNFDPGTGNTHQGFQRAANKMIGVLESYIEELHVTPENLKLMIFGHSRGAAVSNLVAASLIHKENYAPAKNIYTYAFATPSYTTYTANAANSRIFNIINPEDFVPRVLPSAWGFGKYGKNLILPTKTNDANWGSISSRLNTIYDKYKKGCVFPSSINGYMNISLAIDAMTSYLTNQNEFYDKNVVTLATNYLNKQGQFLSAFLLKQMTQQSFYTILQESVLKVLAYNDLEIQLDSYRKVMYENKITRYDFDNFANLLFGDFGLAVIKALAQDIFDFEDFLRKVDSDEFIKNEDEKNIYYATLVAIGKYLLNALANYGIAHEAQTYATYMNALTEEEVLTDRTRNVCYSRCPVDVEVIDNATGEIVAKIMNNKVDAGVASKNNALVAFVDGDSKCVVLPSNGNYEIILTGNDDGLLNYQLATFDAENNELSRVNYFDIPVENGMIIEEVKVNDDEGTEFSAIVNSLGEEIGFGNPVAEADFGALSVVVETEGIGYVTGSGSYTVGDYITLSAETDENNTFLGWYADGELFSEEKTYSFVVKNDVYVTAKFTDVTVELTDITVSVPEIDLAGDGLCFAELSSTPENATNRTVVFKSSDESVVKVSENGLVEGVSIGTATITVTAADGKIVKTVSVSVKCSHKWNDGEVTKPATATEAGERTFTCTVCGATKTEPIDKLPDVQPEYTPGDVDGDGNVTAADARLALRRAVELETYPEGSAEYLACDVDHDGKVTAGDARVILRAAVGLEELK